MCNILILQEKGFIDRVSIKWKLQSSFLPYCDIYLSETASQTRKLNVGRDVFLVYALQVVNQSQKTGPSD